MEMYDKEQTQDDDRANPLNPFYGKLKLSLILFGDECDVFGLYGLPICMLLCIDRFFDSHHEEIINERVHGIDSFVRSATLRLHDLFYGSLLDSNSVFRHVLSLTTFVRCFINLSVLFFN